MRRKRRARVAAIICLIVGVAALIAGALAAIGTGMGDPSLAVVASVAVLAVVGIGGLIAAVANGQQARRQRFRTEGAAVSVLLPNNPTLTAAEVAPNLRSIKAFDKWATTHSIAPAVSQAHLAQWKWEPGATRQLLPRSSAFALRQRSGRFAVAFWIAVLAVAVLLLIDRTAGMLVRGGCGAILLVLIVLAVSARIMCETRAAHEYAAGYTTLTPIRHAGGRSGGWIEPDARTGVDLVDPPTGAVLRAAGAAGISVQEAERRTDVVRARPLSAPTEAQ